MESQHQKWVTLSYLAVAALFGYVVFSLAGKLVGFYDLEVKFRNISTILRVGSAVLGVLMFFFLTRRDDTNQFMNEVMTELSRVSWPTQKETTSSTFIVIVMVLVSGTVLGLLDFLWIQVLKRVL
jgi:preprotein translocase subunit SecE